MWVSAMISPDGRSFFDCSSIYFYFYFFIFASRLYGKEWHETRVDGEELTKKRKTEHQDVDSFFFSIDPFFPSFSGSLAVVGGKESLYSGICFFFGER